MRLIHQCAAVSPAFRLQLQHRIGRAKNVGVRRNVAQAFGRHHAGVSHRRAPGHGVPGRFVRRTDQLQQADIAPTRHLPAQRPKVGGLEGLHQHRRAPGVLVRDQGVEQQLFHRQAKPGEIAGVLDLRDDADQAPAAFGFGSGQRHYFIESGHFEAAVVAGRAKLRQAFARAQGLQLGQAEVLGEPAIDPLPVHLPACPAGGKLRPAGDIGAGGDLVLVACHQHAVARHHQVRLDGVGAVGDGAGVGRQRVLGQPGTGTPVGDHQRGGRDGGQGRRDGQMTAKGFRHQRF